MLESIHRALLPLNDTPSGLRALLSKFRFGRAIRSFIREQCIGGAVVALSFCRVHHPTIDLSAIGKGLPSPPGGGRVLMGAHYAAARGPAENITRLVESEFRAER